MARQLEAGAVNINDVMANVLQLRRCRCRGWKNSGIGSRNGGAEGILKYCRPQAITAPRLPTQSSELLWYPYSRRKFRMLHGRHARSGGARRATGGPQAEGRRTMKCQGAVLRGVGQGLGGRGDHARPAA